MALFTTLALTTSLTAGAALAAGAAVYGTAASISASNRAARASRAAAQTQVTMQRQQATRQRRQAIRANIIRRSQARAQAQAAGVETSSGFAGAMGSLSSQLGTNLGYGSMMSGLGQQFTDLTGQANYQASRASMFGSIAGLGMQGFQYFAGQSGDTTRRQPSRSLPYTMPDGTGVG